MYLKKSPEFLPEFVEFIRIAKKFIEKIFVIETEIFNLMEKIPYGKNIFDVNDILKPYHSGFNVSKILKFFISNLKFMNLYTKLENLNEKKKLFYFLTFVLNERNSIAHNKIKVINKELFFNHIENLELIMEKSKFVYSLNLNKKYLEFLHNLKIRLTECMIEKLNLFVIERENPENKIDKINYFEYFYN